MPPASGPATGRAGAPEGPAARSTTTPTRYEGSGIERKAPEPAPEEEGVSHVPLR